jgi:hypothetical protein
MSIRLALAEKYIPEFVRKRELRNLFQHTARAFDSPAPSLDGLTFDECLRAYAIFTKTSVEQAIHRDAEIADVQLRLFRQAFEYGTLWRKRFGITTMNEVMRAGRILYRAIGIGFRGTDRGEIEIEACFFSAHYSSATCRVISALDAGLMAGLSDGGWLTFSRRITEGFESCKAQLSMKEDVA